MKKITFIVGAMCFAFCGTLKAQGNIISTIAGIGTPGYNGDGILATSAELNYPYGICTNTAGDVYIAEWAGHRIRKIDATSGGIYTIAGTGNVGSTGDGGQATAAKIWGAYDVKVDASGTVYFVDANANRVRKINGTTGIITTIAGTGTAGSTGDGGQATAAEVNYPTGIVLDGSGNIYIADQNNNRIREISASTGIITTIVGTGVSGYTGDGGQATAAKISTPVKLAFDALGNLYFSDNGNDVIRKVDMSTGIITTVVGKGTVGYTGDGGPATAATLSDPTGVYFDATGNMFIGDASNNVVREVIASTGIITTLAGNGTQGYAGDGGLALSAELYHPLAFAFDVNGNLLIDDDLNHVIRKVTAPLAIDNISRQNDNIVLFPNPANDKLTLLMSSIMENNTQVNIYNIMGAKVCSSKIINPSKSMILNTSILPNGTYLCEIITPEGIVSNGKFVVIK